jgi:hypothetical protein
MSPEQLKGLDLDGRSDLYAVGIVFHEILTGSPPFDAGSSLLAALKRMNDPLPRLPPEHAHYQQFLDKLTARNRDERFASGADVIAALRELADHQRVKGAAGAPRPRVKAPEAPVHPPSPAPEVRMQPGEPVSPARPAARAPRTQPLPPTAAASPASSAGLASGLTRALPLLPLAAALGCAAVGVDLIVSSLGRDREPTAPAGAVPAALASSQPQAQVAPFRPAADRPATPAAHRTSSVEPQPVSPVDASAGPGPAAGPEGAAGAAQGTSTALAATQAAGPVPGTGPAQTPPPAAAASPAQATSAQSPQAAPVASGSVSAAAPPATQPAELTPPRAPVPETSRRKEEQREINEAAAHNAQVETQELEIRELLAEATRQYQAGALWQPSGASAADSYRTILSIQPTRPEALAGAQRIASVLAAETESAEGVGDTATAGALLQQAALLDPALPELPALQAGLQALQAQPRTPSSRDSRQLVKAESEISHARDTLNASSSTAAAEAATEGYDRAVELRPRAPGLALLRERLISAYAAAVRGELGSGNPATAMRLLQKARAQGFTSPELEQLEVHAQSSGARPPL